MRKTIQRKDLIRRVTLMCERLPDGSYKLMDVSSCTVNSEIKTCDQILSLCFFCSIVSDAVMQFYFNLNRNLNQFDELTAKVNYLVDQLRK